MPSIMPTAARRPRGLRGCGLKLPAREAREKLSFPWVFPVKIALE
tara:strand:+ start:2442 stop:2576 length:135 start_codon:yes stop_codon:yes gene_type:complete